MIRILLRARQTVVAHPFHRLNAPAGRGNIPRFLLRFGNIILHVLHVRLKPVFAHHHAAVRLQLPGGSGRIIKRRQPVNISVCQRLLHAHKIEVGSPLSRKPVQRKKIPLICKLNKPLVALFHGNHVGQSIRRNHYGKFIRRAAERRVEIHGNPRFFLNRFRHHAFFVDVHIHIRKPVDFQPFGTFLFPLFPRFFALGKHSIRPIGILPFRRFFRTPRTESRT